MQYYFNELDPVTFQRLVNDVLATRYGERLTTGPLRGRDGGIDAEAVTADGKRIVFQVKHHATNHGDLARIRSNVVGDLARELRRNVLDRPERAVDQFVLITNVPSSEAAVTAAAARARELVPAGSKLRVDVWWESYLIALLDACPQLWSAFPQMFAGGRAPLLGHVLHADTSRSAAAVLRAAIATEYANDRRIRFQQTDLDRELARLFVAVDADVSGKFSAGIAQYLFGPDSTKTNAVSLLLHHDRELRHLLIEAGPGHGKSTLTQMVAQIHRQRILGHGELAPDGRWIEPFSTRIPLRLELRKYAAQLEQQSLEECLATSIRKASGGRTFTADDVADLFASPVILLLDGLDEIGSDRQRDIAMVKIGEAIERTLAQPGADCKVVLTTRPPAIAGRRDRLHPFVPVKLVSLSPARIKEYVTRWTSVNLSEERAAFVHDAFYERYQESHVQALARNPMQLALLLHFIHMKGAAFPKRRAELYRDYFKSVIDRDVEKSPALAEKRDLVEDLHKHLAFRLHTRAETETAAATFPRQAILELTNEWLRQRRETIVAEDLFRLGEERLGLIASISGTGEATTYGFDVQPVREYFAAAYFDNQIEGNAHGVFEELVPRPFWREVAFFLAGLRRTNERADLLERLRRVDAHENYGWLHLGRAMALQLIEGGVFTEPKYLMESAADFVLDLFDRDVIAAPLPPENLIPRLRAIVRPEFANLRRRLLRLLRDHAQSPDLDRMRNLVAIASAVLKPAELRERLLSYQPPSARAIAEIRTFAIDAFGADLRRASQAPTFWSAAPDAVWIDRLLTHIKTPRVTELAVPERLHPLLLEQLPFRPLRRPFAGWTPRSKWLAWLFVAFDNLVATAIVKDSPDVDRDQAQWLGRTAKRAVLDGLVPDEGRRLQQLLQASTALVAASQDKRARCADRLLAVAAETCAEPGVVSAVAAWHCARVLQLPPHVHAESQRELLRVVEPFFATGAVERTPVLKLRPAPLTVEFVRTKAGTWRSVDTHLTDATDAPEFLTRIPLPWYAATGLLKQPEMLDPLLRVAASGRFLPSLRKDVAPKTAIKALNDRLTSTTDDKSFRGLLALLLLVPEDALHVAAGRPLLDAVARDDSGAYAANVLRALRHRGAVMNAILETPERFALAYVSAAVENRANSFRIHFPPLASRQRDLGLREDQRSLK